MMTETHALIVTKICLANNGTVNISEFGRIGFLTITGTYTQGANATLVLTVNNAGANGFDALAVGGTATLAGILKVVPGNDLGLNGGASVPLLTFASRANTNFDQVNLVSLNSGLRTLRSSAVVGAAGVSLQINN